VRKRMKLYYLLLFVRWLPASSRSSGRASVIIAEIDKTQPIQKQKAVTDY